jgi:hypothetical protein
MTLFCTELSEQVKGTVILVKISGSYICQYTDYPEGFHGFYPSFQVDAVITP